MMAHLVAVEYDSHTTIANCAKDTPDDPPYYANELMRLRAIVNAFGSLGTLAEELKRVEEVSVQMLAAMPSPASDRKRNIFLFGQGYVPSNGGLTRHTREHFGEVKTLVEAARSK